MMKKRNECVDLLRGIAMVMVVFGHTMGGCTAEAEESLVYNIIWSLQMPLFMIISGFVTQYSKIPTTGPALFAFVKRRTVLYILPWITWTFLVRALLLKQYSFFDLKYLFWNMDSGYWFLISLWTITIIFGVAQFIAYKVYKGNSKSVQSIAVATVFLMGGGIALSIIALRLGISFMTIKLTLYYMPFFILGYIFSRLQNEILGLKYSNVIHVAIVLLFSIVYIVIITKHNLYTMSDSIHNIVLRLIASGVGCMILCWSVAQVKIFPSQIKGLSWIGKHTMDIYLCHYLFLSMVKLDTPPQFGSFEGVGLCIVNFSVTMLATIAVTQLARKNAFIKFCLFGER